MGIGWQSQKRLIRKLKKEGEEETNQRKSER